MVWALTIIALVGYAGAVTFALLRALKKAAKVDGLVAALAKQTKDREIEKEAYKKTIDSYREELRRLNDVVDELLSGVSAGRGE